MTTIPSSVQSEFSAGRPIFDRPSRGRRASRALLRYLVAIFAGIAATLAWQSYGDTAKRIIAEKAPELGWSPESQRMITGLIGFLGRGEPPAASSGVLTPTAGDASQAAPAAPLVVAQKVSAVPSLEPEQVQQIAEDLVALRQAVQQLVTNQDRMVDEIAKLQAADQKIVEKVSTPQQQVTAAPPHKPTRVPIPPPREPLPLH